MRIGDNSEREGSEPHQSKPREQTVLLEWNHIASKSGGEPATHARNLLVAGSLAKREQRELTHIPPCVERYGLVKVQEDPNRMDPKALILDELRVSRRLT